MDARIKRFLSLTMAILMVVALLPANNVFAEDEPTDGNNEPVVCTGQTDCPAETHAEDCLKKLADDEAARKQEEPPKDTCTMAEDCPAETHEEDCLKKLADDEAARKQEEPSKDACTKAVDCPAETHEEDCLKKQAEDEAAQIADAPVLDSIAVKMSPNKISYAVGEALDVTGGKLTLTYSDSTTSEVDMIAAMVSGYDADTIGQQTLTVTYEGKTATFTVKVKQVLPLYAYGTDFNQMSTDQGMPTDHFSTDSSGLNIIPVSELKTTGVAIFREVNSEVWVNATGAGEGTVYYDSDDAIYVFRLSVHHSLYMHAEGGDWEQFFIMTVGQKVQNVSFATDRSGNTIVPIDKLVKDSIVSFEDQNAEGNTLSIVGASQGSGYITYTNNGETYKLEIVVNGDGGNQGGGGGGQNDQHTCDNTEPHLFMRCIMDGTDSCGTVSLGIGDELPGFVYLHSGNGAQQIAFGDLSVTAPASLQETDYPLLLQITDYGEGSVNYTKDGTTYSLKVINPPPAYGLYSTAKQKLDTSLAGFYGEAGEEKEVYLMWNSESTAPASFALSVNEDGTSPVGATTLETAENYIAFKFEMPQATSMWLHLYDAGGNKLASLKFGVEVSGGERPRTVEVKHNGQSVTVGIGSGFIDVMVLSNDGGLRITPSPNSDMHADVCLAALVNYGDKATQAVADESFYSGVTDVSFQMVEWTNFDKTDTTRPGLSAVRKETSAGRETSFVTITKASMKEGQGYLRMTFTYNGEEYRVYRLIQYSNPDITVELSEDLTAQDLNNILSYGAETFLSWLEMNHPVEAAKYDGGGFINLMLPAKEYDAVITVDLAPKDPSTTRINSARLIGQKGTKMVGLVAQSRLFGVSNVAFERTGNRVGTAIAHTTFQANQGDMIGAITHCTFKNYGVAIADVGYGFVRDIAECTFEDCGAGIVMASQSYGTDDTWGYTKYQRNTFIRNDTAVAIERIPDGTTAFSTRITDNTFLLNDVDFEIANLELGNKNGEKVTFYFVRNYFGKKAPNGDSTNANQVRGPAKIVKFNSSKVKVVTNPVRKTIDMTNEYWIYTGDEQHAAIFNSEADNILVDSDSFNTTTNARSVDGGEEIPISIVDDQGNQIAQWTF